MPQRSGYQPDCPPQLQQHQSHKQQDKVARNETHDRRHETEYQGHNIIMGILFNAGRFKATDLSNAPIPGAFLAFYSSTTSTPQAIYTDPTLDIALTNPVQSDGNGLFPEIWLDDSIANPPYKVVFLQPDPNAPSAPGATIWTILQYNTVNQIVQTPAEVTAGVTPTDPTIPSHLITSEVLPQRYGAKFDGLNDDTSALNNAFAVALQAACWVVLPAGTAMVRNLFFGTNNATGASNHPPGMRGQNGSSVLKMITGGTGTVLAAKGIANGALRDFNVDGSGLASICIDTSWPATLGTTALNVYDNIIVQNFTQNGWLAVNDNQSSWDSITSRGAANFGLSGMRIEGSGGSFSLDNVVCGDSFLSITCQSCDMHGGFSQGIRFNETQSGVNYISLMGGMQIYANPTTLSHFEDAHPATHFVTSVVADGLYLLASSGTAQTFSINCGLGGKWLFNGCAFIRGGSTGVWNLYGASATADVTPSIVELNACTMGDVIIDTPVGFITERKDVQVSGAILSDYPMRVVYRNTLTFASGLTINTFTNIVPAAQMAEDGASFLLSVYINAPSTDNLACSALVHAVSRQAAVGPTAAIAVSTTANIANNLTNVISLRYSVSSNVSGINQAGIDAAINIALPNNSAISVTLIRLANPSLNY